MINKIILILNNYQLINSIYKIFNNNQILIIKINQLSKNIKNYNSN
jgi:hypothetical protein